MSSRKFHVILYLLIATQALSQSDTVKNTAASWLRPNDFRLASFKNPSLQFGPMARWWWPGNFVTKEELKREINVFADNGFAGVEVQPLNLAIPTANEEERKKVTSWDTPEYYDNLRAVMEEARRRGLIVDVTNGSGWPPAAPNLTPEDAFLSLEFSDTTVAGGNSISLTLPPLASAKNKTGIPPRLQAVVVAKVLNNAATNGITTLDAASTKVLTSLVNNGKLTYALPEGTWKVIAFWSVPSESSAMVAAAQKGMPVVNHLDSVKVLKLYNHLFGDRTGLESYFGNPMRAVFSDSYEFAVNRHYSLDLLAYFKKKRGYDLAPYLPANMQKGYNYVFYMRPNVKPDFSFSPEDWRLRYDYDITLSELLAEHFFKTSKTWAEKRGLLFRTQAYGLNMDMIAMAGAASIPETESMLGPEAVLKIMSSGALLYNRPIVTAESVVFINRAYTTTPQKIKIAVDKLFAAGVNQIIYHGVPYRLMSEKLGPEGWTPFSSPLLTMVNFSSQLGEGSSFWKDQKEVNEYISRVQYALRSGKPHADVLLYFPFLDVEGTPENEEEILAKGYLKDVEGPLPKGKDDTNPAKAAWAKVVYPLINDLEAAGISWAWVNDASLQEATLTKDGRINIRGNQFQALVLANDSIIQLKTAERIKLLATNGMRLLATGELPSRQPSFLNWKENDRKTAQSIVAALKGENSKYIQNKNELSDWIKTIRQSVQFGGHYSFTRKAERELPGGSRIQFIWNKSNAWQTINLQVDKKFIGSYWMEPATGVVVKNSGATISYQLPPYGSVLLFASTKNSAENVVSPNKSIVVNPDGNVLTIDKWNIKVDSIALNETQLFDWRNNDSLKFSSSEGIYTSSFQWNQEGGTKHFFLDLGKVSFTAEVYLNGKLVGKQIFAPYLLDITSFLKQGANTVEVHVSPSQINSFIGKAKNGDLRYKQFKGKEDQLMSAGLIGPVVIRSAK